MFSDFYSKRAVIDGLSIDDYTLDPIGLSGPRCVPCLSLSLSLTHHAHNTTL